MPRGGVARKGEAGRRNGGGPWLIKHGSDCPSVGAVIAAPATVAALPFDGFVCDGITNSVSSNVMSGTALSLAQCQASLAGMAAAKSSFGQNNRYFLRLLTIVPLDWWNDALWTTISSNWANAASAAAGEGFHALAFDPEYYGTGQSPWDWGSPNPGAFGDSGGTNPAGAPGVGADPTHNLAASRLQVQARGKQVMDAVLAAWPTAKVMSFHGLYVSDVATGTYLDNEAWYGNIAFQNELMGTFVAGFIESINNHGNVGTFIDGGEIYGARTYANFQKVNQWRMVDMKASTSNMMTPAVRSNMRAVMAIAVEELDILTSGFPRLSMATFQQLITYAMRNDSYAWTYTETENWWGGVFPATPVAAATKNAVIAGRDAGRL